MKKSSRKRSRTKGASRRPFLELFENERNERRINFHTSDHRGFEQFAALEIGFSRCECELHPGYRPKIGATLLDCGRCRIDIHMQRPNIAATRDQPGFWIDIECRAVAVVQR